MFASIELSPLYPVGTPLAARTPRFKGTQSKTLVYFDGSIRAELIL